MICGVIHVSSLIFFLLEVLPQAEDMAQSVTFLLYDHKDPNLSFRPLQYKDGMHSCDPITGEVVGV